MVGFVASHDDAFELFEFAEEVLDEVSPLVDFEVDGKGLASSRVLGDDHFRPALVEVGNDPVGVKGLVGDEPAKLDPFDQWRDADCVEALPRQQNEADQVSECVSQDQDFGRQAASRLAYGLARSPPFAPCPWR